MAQLARASDPLPGEAYLQPLNVNIFLLYNAFENSGLYGGQPGNPHGPNANHDTRISADITVGRYVRTFSLGHDEAGVQIYIPYETYLGGEHIGINNLGSAAPGYLPSLGPGRVNLSKSSGFGQTRVSAFLFPVADKATGTYVVISPWIYLPISSFNKNDNLNPNQNLWTFETEIGLRTILIGSPTTRNLAVELWNENYFYLPNHNSADASDVVTADAIPQIYQQLGVTNPVRITPDSPAEFREQPTVEFRVYLPFEFLPATGAFIAPGLYQSFGGKQTYRIDRLGIIDSGNRTEETQLRLIAATFLTPTLQILLSGDYDVVAHGIAYNRTIELRIAKFF